MKQYTDKIKAAYSFFSFSTSKESNRFSMCAQSLMHEPELFIDNVRTVFSPKKNAAPIMVVLGIFHIQIYLDIFWKGMDM